MKKKSSTVSAIIQYHMSESSPWRNRTRHLAVVCTIVFSVAVAQQWEAVGRGQLVGPEDLIYDQSGGGVIYTGCSDGWIKRVTVNESVAHSAVHNWVNTGGRPLGLAWGSNGSIIVGDAYKGLVRVTRKGKVEVLVDEVEGLKFKLTDGVDVAEDGTIYFTDASYKYSLRDYMFDILGGKPHGRLISYDPSTNHTTLLASNLYFANGVAVSPDQQFVVFCETPMRSCRKYNIKGPKKGRIENFIEDLPGLPDNIHYDRQARHYWIGMATNAGTAELSGGLVTVDLKGEPIAEYNDTSASLISSGIKIGNYIYCGSFLYPFILRLHLNNLFIDIKT